MPTARPTWDPAADAPEGAEAEPKVPGGEGAEPYRLPSAAPAKPALESVPKAAAATGKLAAGFPRGVVPVPDGADVESSSVAPQGRRVLVGLEARSGESPEAVLEGYATHCGERGWPVTRDRAPDGADRLLCALGPDSLTVTARQLPTGVTAVTASGAFEARR